MLSELNKKCLQALENVGVLPVQALADYMELVLEWNQKINITGAKDADELALKHIADSILAYKTIGALPHSVADIGSGGGLPGIVLAIASPLTEVFLVEKRGKKTLVTRDIIEKLKLTNRVHVINKSFEEIDHFSEDTEFWFRGFMPAPKLGVYLSEHFPEGELGRLVLMKGPQWHDEKLQVVQDKKIKAIWRERFASAAELNYSLPKNAGERVLAIV